MIQCWYFRLLCQTTKNGVETPGIDSSLTHFHRATQVFWSQNPGTPGQKHFRSLVVNQVLKTHLEKWREGMFQRQG